MENNVIFTRRSIRRFLDKPVEQEKIERILKAGMQAPSAHNMQPWEFVVVTDKDKRDEFFKKYAPNQNSSAKELKKAFDKFVFMHRSSIEHCYPRNPEDDAKKVDERQLDKLNQLGNLCLVSHSENSRLSNLLPEAKRGKVIARLNSGRSTQSLSQLIMLMHETWDISAIDSYTDELKKQIEKPLSNSK